MVIFHCYVSSPEGNFLLGDQQILGFSMAELFSSWPARHRASGLSENGWMNHLIPWGDSLLRGQHELVCHIYPWFGYPIIPCFWTNLRHSLSWWLKKASQNMWSSQVGRKTAETQQWNLGNFQQWVAPTSLREKLPVSECVGRGRCQLPRQSYVQLALTWPFLDTHGILLIWLNIYEYRFARFEQKTIAVI